MKRPISCWMLLVGLVGWGIPLHAFERSAVEKSVVRIINKSEGSTGSGTVINANGDVLTNQHVTNGSHRLSVVSAFSGREHPAQIVWESSEKDLAVIRASGLELPAAPLFTGALEEGSSPRVLAMGYPGAADRPDSLNRQASLSDGVLSHSFQGFDWRVTVLQHSATVTGGNSGGPLFDDCGRVIGVNTQRPHVVTLTGESIPNNSAINWASHINESVNALQVKGIQFTEDAAPCVSGAGAGGADPVATRAAEEATERASAAQSKAESAQQGAQQARQQADAATQAAQEAQARAEQATQAAQEAKQAGKMTNTLMALVAVVTLLALGLALRRPRQQIIRIAGQMIEPLSRPFKSRKNRPKKRVRAQAGPPRMALTGFDPQGQPVKIELRRPDLDRQQGGFTIGRHPLLVDRVLNDEQVSRRHARFSAMNGAVCVEDLNSGNGTTLNGTRCTPFEPTAIQPGDTVNVGNTILRVSY